MKISSRNHGAHPPLEVVDTRVLIDPTTFQPFAMVRVRMNLTSDMQIQGADTCVDFATRLVQEKIK